MRLIRNALSALAALCLLAGPALAADNVAVTPGTGKTMACKDVAGVCFPQHVIVNSSGVAINWSDPVPTIGKDGITISSAANPNAVEIENVVTLGAGSVLVGKVGLDQTTPGTTNNTTRAPVVDAAVGIAPAASSSAEACHVFKASGGNLYSASGYVGAAPAWIMVFNATSAPADGAVTPVTWAYAPVIGSWFINYGDNPAVMTTGITICASSTGPLSKTAVSTNTVFAGRVK